MLEIGVNLSDNSGILCYTLVLMLKIDTMRNKYITAYSAF